MDETKEITKPNAVPPPAETVDAKAIRLKGELAAARTARDEAKGAYDAALKKVEQLEHDFRRAATASSLTL